MRLGEEAVRKRAEAAQSAAAVDVHRIADADVRQTAAARAAARAAAVRVVDARLAAARATAAQAAAQDAEEPEEEAEEPEEEDAEEDATWPWIRCVISKPTGRARERVVATAMLGYYMDGKGNKQPRYCYIRPTIICYTMEPWRTI